MSNILQSIKLHASIQPNAVAIRSALNSISYAELYDDIELVAAKLKRNKVKRLGLNLENSIEWIVVDLAAMLAGTTIVPLPWFFSEAQLSNVIANAKLDSIATSVLEDDHSASLVFYRRCILQLVQPNFGQVTGPTNQAGKISYTSGTTGSPKGIFISHTFIESVCDSLKKVLSGTQVNRHLGVLPYATLLENIAGIYLPLIQGSTIYAESAADLGLSPKLGIDMAKFAQVFNRSQPASLILTPQLLEGLCLLVSAGLIDVNCLKFAAVGGAHCTESLLVTAQRLNIPVHEGYGLTEFASVAILNTPQANRLGSVGKPLPNVSVKIAADGEILLSTKLLGADSKVENYSIETGDYGRIDSDGYVYIQGRKSNVMVLPNGRNVSPEWVEAELNASVLITQSFVYLDAQQRIATLLVASATGADIDSEIERINQHLPAYARIEQWQMSDCTFSVSNQMLTANRRLKRDQIHRKFPLLRHDNGSMLQTLISL